MDITTIPEDIKKEYDRAHDEVTDIIKNQLSKQFKPAYVSSALIIKGLEIFVAMGHSEEFIIETIKEILPLLTNKPVKGKQ